MPAYMYADTNDEIEDLQREADAYARLGATIAWAEVPVPFGVAAGIRFADQARFDPLDFCRGLARVVAADGGEIFEHTRVRRIHDHRKGVTVHTQTAEIEADDVVIATHGPLFGFMSLQTRAHAYQSYVVAVRVRDHVQDALYWDQMEPYHYTRVLRSEDPQVLLIGGADHRTGDESDTEARFGLLRRYVEDRYDVDGFVGKWSHELFEPADKLPSVGALPGRRHAYVATGFSGDGLTWGLVAAEVLADALDEREHPLGDVLTPSRVKALTAASEMAAAGLKIAGHAVGDHLAFADVDDLDEIPRGEGRLIRLGMRRLAVYRDEGGSLHGMSPICRHAGCVVQWNGAARTWDCPCHGGRYDCYGKVIAAPPKDDLERKELDQAQ